MSDPTIDTTARALCVGRHALFDSTDPADHAEAKALCAICPALAACAQALDETRRRSAYAAPEGTWAGQFLDNAEHRNRRAFKAWRAAS